MYTLTSVLMITDVRSIDIGPYWCVLMITDELTMESNIAFLNIVPNGMYNCMHACTYACSYIMCIRTVVYVSTYVRIYCKWGKFRWAKLLWYLGPGLLCSNFCPLCF